MFGFPIFRETPQGPRSTPDIGHQLRRMFTSYLGGLEALWDKTKAADSLMSMDQSIPDEQARGNASVSPSQYRQQLSVNPPVMTLAPSSSGNGSAPPIPSSSAAQKSPGRPRESSKANLKTQARPSSPSQPFIAVNANRQSVAVLSQTNSHTASAAQPSLSSQGSSQPSRPVSAAPAHSQPYEPPIIQTFEDLVKSKQLPLPELNAKVHVPSMPSDLACYAWRAHELRLEIRKMTVNQPRRNLSKDELSFWSKLLMILKRNPTISIPKPSDLLGTSVNAARQLSSETHLASLAVVESVRNGSAPATNPATAPLASVSQPTTSQAAAGSSSVKKRGRPSKHSSIEASGQVELSQAGPSIPGRRPVGRPPKLDANGNRINRCKGRKSNVGSQNTGADVTGTTEVIEQATAAAVPVSDRGSGLPALTQAGDLLRHLQARQQGTSTLTPPSDGLPTSINPALLRRVSQAPAAPVTGDVEPSTFASVTATEIQDSASQSQPNDKPAAGKVKNPKRVEAANRRWSKQKAETIANSAQTPSPTTNGQAMPGAAAIPSQAVGTPQSSRKSTSKALLLSSQSPRKIVNLSGSRISRARMRLSDAATPVKVIGMKRVLKGTPKAGPSQFEARIAPETLAAAMANAEANSRSTASVSKSFALVTPLSAAEKGKTPISSASQPAESPTRISSVPALASLPNSVSRLVKRRPELIVEVPIRRPDGKVKESTPISGPPASRASKPRSSGVARDLKRLSFPFATPKSRDGSPRLRSQRSMSALTSSPRTRRLASVHRPSPLGRKVSVPKIAKQVRRAMSIQYIPSKAKSRPVVNLISSQSPDTLRRGPIDRAKVVIPIGRGRRKSLIRRGVYDAFRDDDSEDETVRRSSHPHLRPMKPLPRSIARSTRPRDPEVIPVRFLYRHDPAMVEPLKSILSEESLLHRARPHPCYWQGCDSVLANENLLEKHFNHRDHLRQDVMRAGMWGRDFFWRCHWKGCEEPCFVSRDHLWQHIKARHISRNLKCPWKGCDIAVPSVSQLNRHVQRHHEDELENVNPLADLSKPAPLKPSSPIDHILPEIAYTDQLTTSPVLGTVYPTMFRREWARAKVAANCFAGENPVMHVEHPPHMLERIDVDSDSEPESDESDALLDAGAVRVERLADRGWSRQTRRFICVVELPTKKPWLVRPEQAFAEYSVDGDGSVVDVDADDSGIELTAEEAAWIHGDRDGDGQVQVIDELEVEVGGTNAVAGPSRLPIDPDTMTDEEARAIAAQMEDEMRHWNSAAVADDEADEQELLDALEAAEAAEAVMGEEVLNMMDTIEATGDSTLVSVNALVDTDDSMETSAADVRTEETVQPLGVTTSLVAENLSEPVEASGINMDAFVAEEPDTAAQDVPEDLQGNEIGQTISSASTPVETIAVEEIVVSTSVDAVDDDEPPFELPSEGMETAEETTAITRTRILVNEGEPALPDSSMDSIGIDEVDKEPAMRSLERVSATTIIA
ncbi:hypothetical protein BD324DRAFT_149350 [Kockovaella imperatae]|uniref:C2H2-type domain-containing protein n=1 Tax=Kockovaella imperatae TaxID=4999 RepID=A0A1Y1U8S0_9TREE|nr:hypothetical protein BD324DRAFT_149350 [Kockovaella imperatae]ORX34418.1 hypothetical protein BD324DRAFT_149350 [Kockovaella imperatae]